MAHVHALAGVDQNGKRHFFLFAVQFRIGVDVGECVTEVTQAFRHLLGAVVELFAVEHIAFFQRNQRPELILAAKHLAFQLDVGNCVFFTFIDVDGDVDIFLVRRNRDLGRLYLHLDITAIQVIRTQGFDIAREFFFRVLVSLGVPGKPAWRTQFYLVAQGAIGKCLVADETDFLDAGYFAFIHRKRHIDPVTLDRRDGSGHFHAIQPA